MLHEHKFETRTRGLICGPSSLVANNPVPYVSIIDPKVNQFRTLDKREFNVLENHLDGRIFKTNSSYISTYKIVIRSIETKEEIWTRPFGSKQEAFLVWARLIGLDLERIEQQGGIRDCPSYYQEGDLEYLFATVNTFTSTGDNTWSCPTRVFSITYVMVAGGGSGAALDEGGGGGAGGYLASTYATLPGTNYTFTVGSGAPAAPNVTGTRGSNSVLNKNSVGGGSAVTATGGGGGKASNQDSSQQDGGSGGGGGGTIYPRYIGGSGIAGQGYNGGDGSTSGAYNCAGGGGAGGVGQNGNSGSAGNGGYAASSSLSGSTVYYAGGGGGGTDYYRNSGASYGLGGGTTNSSQKGGGGNGGHNSSGSDASSNTGGGGGGNSNRGGYWGGAGGSGILVISYVVSQNLNFNMPLIGF